MSEPSLGKDRQRAERLINEAIERSTGESVVPAATDAALEFAAQEAEWWVADLGLGGMELDGDHKHLRRRAAELRAQKATAPGNFGVPGGPLDALV